MTVRLLGPEVGGERELLEGTSRNEFQIVQSGDMGIAIYAPKYAVTSVPFVFPDYSPVQKAYAGKRSARCPPRSPGPRSSPPCRPAS